MDLKITNTVSEITTELDDLHQKYTAIIVEIEKIFKKDGKRSLEDVFNVFLTILAIEIYHISSGFLNKAAFLEIASNFFDAFEQQKGPVYLKFKRREDD